MSKKPEEIKTVKARTWLDLEVIDRFTTKCTACKTSLDFETTGMQKVSGGYMCDDCYFDALGEEIEKHPIGIPRTPRRK